MIAPTPYRSTPAFDETTLPASQSREHQTKEGVWGVIRILKGQVADSGGESIPRPDSPGLILPQLALHLEPLSKIRMQFDFNERAPSAPGLQFNSHP